MLHENYKNKLTNSQRSIFERLEKELKDQITETENKIKAVNLLEYCPKKDGTPKQNFGLNFGLVKPWGESYRVKRWNNQVETNRFVEVWLERNFNGNPTGVNFRFKPYYDDGKGTDEKPETGFKYFDDIVYFGWDGFEKWAGFDTSKEPERVNAEFSFKVIKEFYMDNKKKSLEGYKKELEELPEWFSKALEMARKMGELVESSNHLTTIHSFMYGNFEAKEIYYLNH